jgi:hypothetical protein
MLKISSTAVLYSSSEAAAVLQACSGCGKRNFQNKNRRYAFQSPSRQGPPIQRKVKIVERPDPKDLSTFWQTHLPDSTADSTSLLNQAHVQYQSGTGGSTVEKPAKTQTSIRLTSHLVRAPNWWT